MNKEILKVKVLDGHSDTFKKLFLIESADERSFLEENNQVHIDLIKAKRGGLVGGFSAIMVPQPADSPERDPYYGLTFTDTGYDVLYRSPIDCDYAIDFTDSVLELINNQVELSNGEVKVLRSYGDFVDCVNNGVFSVILHLEGAAAIKKDLSNLKGYYDKGIRSIGLAWSRPNAFAYGVPYKYPHSPDTGPGLTEAGKDLVKACDELGIVVDLAHLNEKGFWDVAGLSSKPLVVSHAGVHQLCPSTRNLTDDQIDAVGRSGGVVGILFESTNLQPNGMPDASMPISRIVEHISYVAKRIGVDHVAFGSDFDGADLPDELPDASFFPVLLRELGAAGYTDDEIEKIAYKNWIRVVHDTWKS